MFYDRFIQLCSEKGVKPTPLVISMGLSSSNVSQWKKGSTPRPAVLKKLADYFGVSTEYLMFGSDAPEAPAAPAPAKKEPPAETGEQFSPLDSRWFSLTEEEKLQAWEFIVQLRAKKQGGDGE